MNWTVDAPIQIGSIAIAAVVETRITAQSSGEAVFGVGDKRPLLILCAQKGHVGGIDMNDRNYDGEAVETLFPEAISRFRQLLRSAQ